MHDVLVNFVRSKDAQKQLAQTSLREQLGTLLHQRQAFVAENRKLQYFVCKPLIRALLCPPVNYTNYIIHIHVVIFLPAAEAKMLGKYPPHCVN